MLELEMNELTQEELKLIEEHRNNKKKIKLEDKELSLKEKLNQEPYPASPKGLIEEAKDKEDFEELKEEYYNKQMKLTLYNKQQQEIAENIRTTEIELLDLFKKMKEYL